MSSPTLISLIAALAFGGAAIGLYAQNQDLADRIDTLESRAGSMHTPVDGETLPTLGGEPMQARVGEIYTDLTRLKGRLGKAEQWIQGRKKKPMSGGTGAAIDLDSPALDDMVRNIVVDMAGDVRFREKLGLRGGHNLPKKPAFGQLAEVLELDVTQEEALRKDLMALKEEFMALISLERDDGIVPLEEIQKVEGLGERDPKRVQAFMQLFTLKIPGTEETYVSRLVTLSGEMRSRTTKYLREEQVKRFNGLDIDLLGVQLE